MLNRETKCAVRGRSAGLRAVVLAAVVMMAVVMISPDSASAGMLPEEMRTVFAIANLHTLFTPGFPLPIYAVNGQTLSQTYILEPPNRAGGPIGLAVDVENEHLFVTYEDSRKVDVINARSAESEFQIWLTGTSDLAGIEVLESRNQLFVVDRAVPTIYVYDTISYSPVNTWNLPTGEGAYGIRVEENVDGADVIFVTDGTPTVRWYDIDTHQQVGTATFSYNAIGLGVDNSSNFPVLYTAAFNPEHDPDFPTDHNRLQKFDVQSGTETFVTMQTGGRGVYVNAFDHVVYVTVGSYTGRTASVRVYRTADLVLTGQYDLDFCGWLTPCTPTDIVATSLSYGTLLEKELTSHPGGEFDGGEDVVFTVTVTNKAFAPLHKISLTDAYDTAQISYKYSLPASNNNVDDGQIDWSNLIQSVGSDLPVNDELSVAVHFKSLVVNCPTFVGGENQVEIHSVETDNGTPLPNAVASVSYRLNCVAATTTTTSHPPATTTTHPPTTTTPPPTTTTVTTTTAATTTTHPWPDDDVDDDQGLGQNDDTVGSDKGEEEGWPKGKVSGGCCGC